MFVNVRPGSLPKTMGKIPEAAPLLPEKILGVFDEAHFINLDTRTDRRREIEEELRRVGILAQRFAAVKPVDPGRYGRIGKRGCAESHFSLIQYAKDKGLESILIFEDDARFSVTFKQRMPPVARFLMRSPWDMFFFHISCGKDIALAWDDEYTVYSLTGTFQTHAYAVRRSAYDLILSCRDWNADDVDWLYRETICRQCRTFATYGLVEQSRSPSDVTFEHGCANPRPSRQLREEEVRAVGRYIATHTDWFGSIELRPDGTFLGGPLRPNGTWTYDGVLTLHWFHWPQQILRVTVKGFKCEGLTLLRMK